MEWLSDFFHMISSPEGITQMIAWGGYFVLFAIVFSETGLLIGFFLPGDSLLVTAGVMAAGGILDIVVLNAVLIPAAIIGDATGYSIGLRSGQRLLAKPNSRWFRKEHLVKTQKFYAKHGGKTIVLARFIPLIRTFAPVVAGIARMPYRQFALYNIFGGIFWISSTTLTGYFLGSKIPNVSSHLHYVIIIVVVLSLLPVVIEIVRGLMRRRRGVVEATETKE